MTTAGVILAGGFSRRMGQEKSLLPIGGQPMFARIAGILAPQLGPLALNANGDPARFGALDIPIIGDDVPDTGPLGGVLAGLIWAESLTPRPDYLLSVPVDTPFLPRDLVARLRAGSRDTDGGVVIAASGDRDHPVVALWPVGLSERLAEWRSTAKSHGVRGFLSTTGFTVVDFPVAAGKPDPFLNVNTPEDFAEAERWLAEDVLLC